MKGFFHSSRLTAKDSETLAELTGRALGALCIQLGVDPFDTANTGTLIRVELAVPSDCEMAERIAVVLRAERDGQFWLRPLSFDPPPDDDTGGY